MSKSIYFYGCKVIKNYRNLQMFLEKTYVIEHIS